MKRIILLLGVIGLGAFAGHRIWESYERLNTARAKTKGQAAARVVAVTLGEAKIGSIRQELTNAGALKPKEQVDITAKATGRVEKINYQIGDRVEKGELIAELEDDELVQQVNRANASLAVARATVDQRRAELANSKSDLERFQALFDQGLIPKREYQAQQTSSQVFESQLQLAMAQVRQAQAELNEFKIQQRQTHIAAPMTGWVARRHVDVGALVNASTPILTLVNLSTMVTVASVPEREVGKLRVGMTPGAELDAFGDKTFIGRVARISPVLDPATRSAMVEIEIPNPEGQLKAEMFARVKLGALSTRAAVLIPRAALVYRGAQPGVYVVQNNQPLFRAIEVGVTEGEHVEALTNLQPGAKIVSTGASMLSEGDRIRVVKTPADDQSGGA